MKFTRHAKSKISERGITEAMILEAISHPTQTYYDLSTGATIVFKKLDNRHLLVAYSKEDGEIKVVTTFITSDAKRIIGRKLGRACVKIR
ncbi:MAG: DUF4258 domain-containing protein [Nitrososphaerota archaeon]|nr:DUF4258 domain-containing protein [Candidatus Bathyarchaeota archaeon]MDW8022537.1 DUF4258 domain-containing protein [Nitrososphaerota archaeon]